MCSKVSRPKSTLCTPVKTLEILLKVTSLEWSGSQLYHHLVSSLLSCVRTSFETVFSLILELTPLGSHILTVEWTKKYPFL